MLPKSVKNEHTLLSSPRKAVIISSLLLLTRSTSFKWRSFSEAAVEVADDVETSKLLVLLRTIPESIHKNILTIVMFHFTSFTSSIRF